MSESRLRLLACAGLLAASALSCADKDPCARISGAYVTRVVGHPGSGREIGVSLGFRDGTPVEDNLAGCVSLSGAGLGAIAASKRPADVVYTLLLVAPGASAQDNEWARTAVRTLIMKRPASERVAIMRWGGEVTQVAPFLADRPALEDRLALGLPVVAGAPASAAVALAAAADLVAKVGGPGASAQRTVIVVSARPLAPLSSDTLRAAEPALVLSLGRSSDLAVAVAAVSKSIDAHKQHGHVVLGACGVAAGGGVSLRAGSITRPVVLLPLLPEQAAGVCQPGPLASGAKGFARRIELNFTVEQRVAADQVHRMRSKDNFDLSVRMSPDSLPVTASAHFRGESSYGCTRRNYSVNLTGKAPRFVFPGFAQDKFHLVSMCLDRLYLRNLTALSLMADAGLFPLPFDVVELVLDGQEQGVYLLIENVADALPVHQSRVTSVLRRYKTPTGSGTLPELKFAAPAVGEDAALASYRQIIDGVQGLSGDKLEAGLRRRLNLDQYLTWLALLNGMQSGDYLDEVFFYAAETTDAEGKPGAWHQIMGWDQDDLYTACHFQGVNAVNDPAGIIYCAEAELDRVILGDPVLYRRYATTLGAWLERVTVERFAERVRGIADGLLRHFANPKVLAAMTELSILNPDAVMSLDVARTMFDRDLELLVTQYQDRRTALLARLQKLGGGLPPDPSKVPDGGTSGGEAGPGELVVPRAQPDPPTIADAVRIAAPVAGTRLKALSLEGEGARLPMGFRDSKLDERCSFAKLSDGSTRCLPARTTVTSLRYADPVCTKPVQIVAAAACDVPNLVVHRTTEGCPGAQFLYRRTDKVVQTNSFSRTNAGACVVAPALAPGDALHVLELTAASTFAAATPKLDPSARVVAEIVVAEDGAQDSLGLRDSMLGHSCLLATASDGVLRCLPSEALGIQAGLYTDDQCQTPAALGDQNACTTAAYALRFDPGRVAVLRVGERSMTVFNQGPAGGRCTAITGFPMNAFPVGAEIPPAAFAAGFTIGAAAGAGRLRTLVTGVAAQAVPRGGFFDTELRLSCASELASDGIRRCLPQTDATGTFFADGACAIPLVSRPVGSEPPGYALVRTTGVCPVRTAVRRVGAAFRGQIFGSDGAGRCTARMYPADRSLFNVGPEAPAAQFAELKLVEL